MPRYTVNWSNDRCDPRSSSWYVLEGVITQASTKLKAWEGRQHRDLVIWLGQKGFYVEEIGRQHIPTTKKYHRELLACTLASLELLEARQSGGPREQTA